MFQKTNHEWKYCTLHQKRVWYDIAERVSGIYSGDPMADLAPIVYNSFQPNYPVVAKWFPILWYMTSME